MPEQNDLDVLVNRMDVLCSVLDDALKPGGRATKHDLRLLHEMAQKVVTAYFADKLKKENTETDNEKCGYSKHSDFKTEIRNA